MEVATLSRTPSTGGGVHSAARYGSKKIAASLVSMSRRTSNYVESIADIIAGDTELKEVELEYMCALANDIATHIEEVIALVDGFALAEVRGK